MRKVFRVIKNDLACPEAYHPLWYRIEQRHTLLFFFHLWTTPEFEPPHNFENVCDAMKHIKEHYPNAVVYDYYSENKLSNKVMKANGASEKLYFTSNENGTHYYTEDIPFERKYVEYIRTDDFIEKARKWFEQNEYFDFNDIRRYGKDDFEDFKKYMEGG